LNAKVIFTKDGEIQWISIRELDDQIDSDCTWIIRDVATTWFWSLGILSKPPRAIFNEDEFSQPWKRWLRHQIQDSSCMFIIEDDGG
jgi:hypothetical protein